MDISYVLKETLYGKASIYLAKIVNIMHYAVSLSCIECTEGETEILNFSSFVKALAFVPISQCCYCTFPLLPIR